MKNCCCEGIWLNKAAGAIIISETKLGTYGKKVNFKIPEVVAYMQRLNVKGSIEAKIISQISSLEGEKLLVTREFSFKHFYIELVPFN